MRIFFMIALSALVCGCASDHMGSRLNSWQGTHFNEVSAAWGAPDECSDDEAQRICTWQVRQGFANVMQPSIERITCTTMLAFDADGLVTGWRWRGDHCQQTASVVAAHTPEDRPDAFALSADDETALGVATVEPTGQR